MRPSGHFLSGHFRSGHFGQPYEPDLPIQEPNIFANVKKYFGFTAEETAEDIGWSHRGFLSDASFSSFGSIDHPSEAYLYGMKILGLGFSKESKLNRTGVEAYLALTDDEEQNSTDRHTILNKPLIEKIKIFNRSPNLKIADIKSGLEEPIIDINFARSILNTDYCVERGSGWKSDILYIAANAALSADLILINGDEYFVEVELNRQILRADESEAPALNSFSGPLIESKFDTNRLVTLPRTGVVFAGRDNTLEITVKSEGRLIDLSRFDRFVLICGETTIDTDIDTDAIITTVNKGQLLLKLGPKVSTAMSTSTRLIAYSEKMPFGVILWDKSLTRSNLMLNILNI